MNTGPGCGLIYSSVQSQGAVNLAVRAEDFDKLFEVLWTEVLDVNYLGYGMYFPTLQRFGCDFGASGTINWTSKRTLPYARSLATGASVSKEYVGWRTPLLH